MGERSAISWTDHTFNPWRGCARVSPGCQHCYAEAMARRNPKVLGEWGATAARVPASERYWRLPTKWDAEAEAAGRRALVFCASLADVFEDRQDLDEHRERLWALIEATPNLVWLLLTKRPRNIYGMVPWPWIGDDCWPENVWIGTTAEDQRRADERVGYLLEVPAPVRFLSCEPLLGPVDLGGDVPDWVIVGGESGPRARPMDADWVRGLRDQAVESGVPFHFKQWGGTRPDHEAPELDGQVWREFPGGR